MLLGIFLGFNFLNAAKANPTIDNAKKAAEVLGTAGVEKITKVIAQLEKAITEIDELKPNATDDQKIKAVGNVNDVFYAQIMGDIKGYAEFATAFKKDDSGGWETAKTKGEIQKKYKMIMDSPIKAGLIQYK